MDYENFILVFTSIVYEALPFIVLGVVLAGVLEEYVPQQFIAKLVPRSRTLAIALGGFLGLLFPMCECGIIPIMRRLLRKGLPLSVCVCYMLAGPIINVVVMLSTYVAFDTPDPQFYIFDGPGNVVLLRAGIGFLVAFNTALIVERQFKKHGMDLLSPRVVEGLQAVTNDEGPLEKQPFFVRLGNIAETALNDFVDIMAFLILGACLASIGRAVISDPTAAQNLFEQTPAVAILIMMGTAVLFCLCSEADAFVAANFQMFWPPASKLAFLVLGPMLDLKLYLMYTRIFRPRLIWTIIPSVAVQVFVYMTALHYLWPLLPEWVRFFFYKLLA